MHIRIQIPKEFIMQKHSLFSFRRGDLLAIALVLLAAAAVACFYIPFGGSSENAAVQVYMDGSLIREISLKADQQFDITGEYSNTIAVQNGKAAIIASDCPGEDCVHSGWISKPGRSIVCLPNRVEIRISGQGDVDFVVR